MRRARRVLGLGVTMALTALTGVFAQTGTVRGVVHTSAGEVLEQASVWVKGTRKGTKTAKNGRYRLNDVPAGNQEIEVSHVGMARLRVPVQVHSGEETILDIRVPEAQNALQEVVVTGQYEPQSLRQSVYQVRTIGPERLQARAAMTLTGVLNTELGIRFSNDPALGTSDIQLMGMSGRNVKILLDGVPMLDRGDQRESLNQIDINSVERIEIVEGPMSVSYGSDALAGVINIITKKPGKESLSALARIQEETAGKEYAAFSGKGSHLASLQLSGRRNNWHASVGGSRNQFGGWQGTSLTRTKDWHQKDQWLGNGVAGFTKETFSVSYRLDALQEKILALGAVNENTRDARDQNFITRRYMHQLQSSWKVSDGFSANGVLAYTDYSRRTQTTILNLTTGQRTLSTGTGEQDVSGFDNAMLRLTGRYRASPKVSFQPGLEINRDAASGARIEGRPVIVDAAFYVSSEIKPTEAITIRPGLRFIKNSVYAAPPVIPSLNTRFGLTKTLDLRLAYARGFRSPALRELYFTFFDASHSIRGNPDLKAEYSNSFNGSLAWQPVMRKDFVVTSTLGGFYNDFHNLIGYGNDAADPQVTVMINVDRFKTTGVTFNQVFNRKNLQVNVGYSYIGRFNQLSATRNELPQFVWSPEVNLNLLYTFSFQTRVNLFYKYTGPRTSYQTTTNASGETMVTPGKTQGFHTADITASQPLFKGLTLNGGARNLFDVTSLTNTAVSTGSAHSTGGPVPMSYGRSYFLGLTWSWSTH
ncbi:TonB-dependent receptor [Siphonobacter aquaeclarae]|uniref:Outer membrane receptor for ferrienterochelin and colicins n=1 Tax=Siphonobacter aquaeclarae TaxID=563176 RepID=A0A1G9WB33_9BACT|nr:TonB-dependent receptor [Siphonobacter aquaeclarae]SDM81700.1 outer membrane receptor for ferrienterochelin and colicins [Siphonobacter aquaeclarae]